LFACRCCLPAKAARRDSAVHKSTAWCIPAELSGTAGASARWTHGVPSVSVEGPQTGCTSHVAAALRTTSPVGIYWLATRKPLLSHSVCPFICPSVCPSVCPRQLESCVCMQHCTSRATSTTGLFIIKVVLVVHVKKHRKTATVTSTGHDQSLEIKLNCPTPSATMWNHRRKAKQ